MSRPTSQIKSDAAAWYVSRGGDATGPFSTDMLLAMLRNSQLQPLDLVFREGDVEWRPVATYRELKLSASKQESSNSLSTSAKSEKESGSIEKGKSTESVGSKTDPRALSWIVLTPHKSTYLQEGPLETQAIIDGLEKGRFQFSQYAWHVGMSQWMRIGDLREFDRRSRSRESKPHVPPPLPDPIAAVMLEDDSDSDAEEFHIAMRGSFKADLTPNPLESMQAIAQLGNAAIGGAAAESPEQMAKRSASPPNDLAGVPWERGAGGYDSKSVELIDDQHSGVHGAFAADLDIDDDSDDVFSFTPSPATSDLSSDEWITERFEKTPMPFLPAAPMPISRDHWEKWGRHVAGAGLSGLVGLFGWHLATYEIPRIETVRVKTAAAAVVSSVEPATLADPMAEDFGSPDDAGRSVRVGTKPVGSQVAKAEIPLPSVPVAAVSTMPTAAAVAPVVASSKELGIVGIKLDQPDGQIVIQGSFPPGVPVELSFKGRLGQILSKLNVRKTITVARKNGEVPSVKLKSLRLPAGAYTVEVKVGDTTAKNEIFIGNRSPKFLDDLETHLRENALETQSQKKALFYAAQEMNVLARDLGQNYGQLRGKPEQWAAFYGNWKRKLDVVNRSLTDVRKRSVDDQAYPEEAASLVLVQSKLKDVATQYDQAIGQSRDVASDTLTELISELTRQKDLIGQATARPMANTPDGRL